MRILLVSHRSLPAHPAGTEVHTHQMAREFLRLGHTVLVLTAEKDVSRRHHALQRREHDGVPYVELVDNLFRTRFEETYRDAGAEQRFEQVLREFRPDVVHAAHLMYHSFGYARVARASGVPFFATLFDYFATCPRFGQRRFPDGSSCTVIDHARCGACITSLRFAATPLERTVGTALSALRSATGVDLAPLATRLAGTRRAEGLVPDHATSGDPAPTRERARFVLEEFVPHVNAFVAPSRFLLEEHVRFGFPRETLHFLRTGIDLAPFAGFVRERARCTRVAFIGSVVPHKGLHVLVEAFERLQGEVRTDLELHVHGPATHAPDYGAGLERRVVALGGTWHGPLAREALPGALARTDLLVVPSVWFENAPLVVLEALATHTPFAVSDIGGLSELAQETGAGFTFAPGDAGALAALLERLVLDHAPLERASEMRVDVRSITDDARDCLALYAAHGVRT
jgi:glycosyltransferase involved in cell wall biosynthesis